MKLRQFVDGTTTTLLLAEKFLRWDFYDSDAAVRINSCADNNSAYQGYDWDVIRRTNRKPRYQPAHDRSAEDVCSVRFGSAHTSGMHAVYADGSVHTIEYGIDPLLWEYLGDRNDRQ